MPKSEDVLQIRLGVNASLDVVRKPQEKLILLVFAERERVQRRTIVSLHFDQAQELARFLQGVKVDDLLEAVVTEEVDDDTKPMDLGKK